MKTINIIPKKCSRCGCHKIEVAYGYRVFQRHLVNGEDGHIFDEELWWSSRGRQDVLNRLLENGIKSTQYKKVEVEEKPLTRHISCSSNSCSLGRQDYEYNRTTKKYEWVA